MPRVSVRSFVQVAVFGSASTLAAPALAEDAPTFHLDYRRAAALATVCPDDVSFKNLVVARLGYDPFDASRVAKGSVRVELSPRRGRVQAAVTLLKENQPPRAPRALDGAASECEALVAALATTVAIALDPGHVDPPAPPPEPRPHDPEPEGPTLPPPSSPEGAAPEAKVSAHPPFVVFVSAAPVASVGLTPFVSVGGEAGVGLRGGVFSIEAVGRAESMPATHNVTSGALVEPLTAAVFSGALVPCGEARRVRVCGVVRIGVFEGSAPNLPGHAVEESVYAAIGLRVGYALVLTDALTLEPSLETDVPLTRTGLNAATSSGTPQSLWLAPVLSGSAAVALQLTF